MKKLTFIIILGILIVSCTKPEDENNTLLNLEKVSYEIADDQFVTVILDPNLEPKTHSFNSLDAHDDFLIQLEETSNNTITVNKKMYEDLSHYFDPYQISILDKNYAIKVGDDVFKATKEAIYKKSKGTDNWKLYIYYGLSGKVSLEETELIHKNYMNLSKLEGYQFKCPDAKALYQKKLQGIAKRDTKYFYSDVLVKYRETNNGSIKTASIRWKCWNESYKRFGRKGKGGTVTEIKRSGQGWKVMNDNEIMGKYLLNGETDESRGYVKVQVKTSKGSKTREGKRNVSVDKVKRKKKRGTWSYHNGSIRDNNTGEMNRIMRDFKVN
ncbi:hypothetical protein [Aquimarina sp. RZ0]|uniref:hypothetical protein n=1 Tax=Aquimarina sp. RZ0 TaxID=2607730 RepID=UPI0011F29030|nr:hypothetical protein [Aquimarina sp. RZ0]KAA1242420.1 hypothetical protein F0000_25690 [Aquimarina sp. RZ0]